MLAVRISPPPHPGIPQEQSIKGGPGENGGIMVLDGPTFVATEGWDWIPGIRDRNTGIWQDVDSRLIGTPQLGRCEGDHHTCRQQTAAQATSNIDVPIHNSVEVDRTR